jgi:hypothetical protein
VRRPERAAAVTGRLDHALDRLDAVLDAGEADGGAAAIPGAA